MTDRRHWLVKSAELHTNIDKKTYKKYDRKTSRSPASNVHATFNLLHNDPTFRAPLPFPAPSELQNLLILLSLSSLPFLSLKLLTALPLMPRHSTLNTAESPTMQTKSLPQRPPFLVSFVYQKGRTVLKRAVKLNLKTQGQLTQTIPPSPEIGFRNKPNAVLRLEFFAMAV